METDIHMIVNISNGKGDVHGVYNVSLDMKLLKKRKQMRIRARLKKSWTQFKLRSVDFGFDILETTRISDVTESEIQKGSEDLYDSEDVREIKKYAIIFSRPGGYDRMGTFKYWKWNA